MMMKQLGTFILLLMLTACSTKQVQHVFNHQKQQQDTSFIYRQVTKSSYHAIYIDTNANSKRYEAMMDFDFRTYDSSMFLMIYQDIVAKTPNLFSKHELLGLPTEWLPLYPYKHNFYLYAPCDWGYLAQRILSDSTYIAKYSDGPHPYPINSLEKINTQKYKLTTASQGDEFYDEIFIHVLDTTTYLTLWEFSSTSDQRHYQLYIPREHAKRYDIFVNDCKGDQEDEFTFDKINYDSLKKTFH